MCVWCCYSIAKYSNREYKEGLLTAVSIQGISRSMIMSTTATMMVEIAAPMALLQILSPLYSLLFSVKLQISVGKLVVPPTNKEEYSSTRYAATPLATS